MGCANSTFQPLKAEPEKKPEKFFDIPVDKKEAPLRRLTTMQLGSIKKETLNMRESPRTGVKRVNEEFFPLHVMSVDDVLKLDRLVDHEQMVGEDKVFHVPADGLVIFVSHQWLSFKHPDDPNNVQLRALQRMLRTIKDGRVLELFEESDWNGFATGVDASKVLVKDLQNNLSSTQQQLTPEAFASIIEKAYIWWDFFSIPQLSTKHFPSRGVSAPKGNQLLAIESIPFYLERASFLVVCAPESQHVDTGKRCDLESWRGRGWCRLEEWANFLSLNAMNPIVLTEQPKCAVEEFGDFWAFRANTRRGAVGCGDFTNDADRPMCTAILQRMWQAKLQHLASLDKRQLVTLFGALESKIYATSEAVPLTSLLAVDTAKVRSLFGPNAVDAAAAPDKSAAAAVHGELLTEWKLGCLAEAGHPIGAPIVSAMLGDARLLTSVFDEGGTDVYATHGATGATTLMHAAGCGSIHAVRFFLERVDPMRVGDDGIAFIDRGTTKLNTTPIDRAIRCGHDEIVQLLLDSGASPHVACSSGDTPLHAAADMGRVVCARALLAAGAKLDARNNKGQTPLHLATTGFSLFGSQAGKSELALVLLDAGACTDLADKDGHLPISA